MTETHNEEVPLITRSLIAKVLVKTDTKSALASVFVRINDD